MKELPRLLVPLLLLAGLAALAYVANSGQEPPKPIPKPPTDPDCPDDKCPSPKKPRWGDVTSATVCGPRHADGTEVMLDLPASLHQRNAGDRKSTRLNSSHHAISRMPSSA